MNLSQHSTVSRHLLDLLFKGKLAGPATGSYDGGQKMSSQKRKRDKAQEQLRTRMRQRMNGSGTSSTLLQGKRRSGLLEGKGDTNLSAGLRHSSSLEVTAKDMQGSNYWRSQQERYNTLTQIPSGKQPRISSSSSNNQTVPLQELVDRVLHRKEQNFGLGSKISPMTIRAYKPPTAPYAIQQSTNVKKIVGLKPIQRREKDDKGPFVLVLQRNGNDASRPQNRGRGRHRARKLEDPNNLRAGDIEPSMTSTQVLPPVNASRTFAAASEVNTWRPELQEVHQPSVLPEAEDRSVTNYRLQLQHASKLAESRFEFQHQVQPNQTVEEMTMQSLNPLPPIQSVYSDSESETSDSQSAADEEGGESSESGNTDQDQQQSSQTGSESFVDRTTSKSEILNLKKAQREAKRQKQSQAEELTLLRTRKRFTNKTKQFKNDFERARQLSAIQEDRSSLSSARLSQTSARKAQSLSSGSSANSLRRIEETNNPNSFDNIEENGPDDGHPTRSTSGQSNHATPLAPPTTPAVEVVQLQNDVIMNVDVMNSPLEDSSSEESGDESSDVEDSEMTSDVNSSSSSDEVNEEEIASEEKVVSEEEEVASEDEVMEGMTWVDGEIPFRQNSPAHQTPTAEHCR